MPGIQGRKRILEHDLHLSAYGTKLARRQRCEVATIQSDGSTGDRCQSKNCAPGCRFSTPGLADKPKCLPAVDLDCQAINGLDGLFATAEPAGSSEVEVDLKVFDSKQWGGRRSHIRTP
jgi:hypothetical protein